LKTQTKCSGTKIVKRRTDKGLNAHKKAVACFGQLLAERMDSLGEAQGKVAIALRKEHGEAARDIAFHLFDWTEDAWFIVAVFLFPDRFTAAEIRRGIAWFLIHAPNHIAAAAKLAGWPVTDVFHVGAIGRKPVQR
jgi:uncharacterized protein YoaH (UPF0181 family)